MMVYGEDLHSYNLGVVLQETGLKADTLRAWERRYGLPQPERSPGGHRLYSKRDIEIIMWLMARQNEGMSISKAVKLWKSLEADNKDPLTTAEFVSPSAGYSSPLATGTIPDLLEEWVSACRDFDEQRSETILSQAFALHPPEIVCFEVLQKGLAQLGEEWYQGELMVQQEHFASGLAKRRLSALIAATPNPTRHQRILLVAPPGEEHDIILLLLTLLLRRRSLDVLNLGANVPVSQLESVLKTAKPVLVVAAAQRLQTAATLMEMAQLLLEEKVPLAYGGLIFNSTPEIRQKIPGYFLGEEVESVVQIIEHILVAPGKAPSADEFFQSNMAAVTHFRENLSLIEAEILKEVNGFIHHEHLTEANKNMREMIEASLAFGDMNLMDRQIEWIDGLLSARGFPSQMLSRYLAIYHKATQMHTGPQCVPVVNWLGNKSNRNA